LATQSCSPPTNHSIDDFLLARIITIVGVLAMLIKSMIPLTRSWVTQKMQPLAAHFRGKRIARSGQNIVYGGLVFG
jgi:hypothetical protein